MSNPTWNPSGTPRRGYARSSIAARRGLGQVVYAVRMGDGTIKIGCTKDFGRRVQELGSPRIEILGFMSGNHEDEQAIHAGLKPYRHHGREWYHPTPEVLAVVNRMRDRFNLPHIAA